MCPKHTQEAESKPSDTQENTVHHLKVNSGRKMKKEF